MYHSYSCPVFITGEEPYILTDENGQVVAQGMRLGDIADASYAALAAGYEIEIADRKQYIAMVDKLGNHELAERLRRYKSDEPDAVPEPYVLPP